MGGTLAAVVLAVATAVAGGHEGVSAPGAVGATPSVPELVSPAAEAVGLAWEAPAGCPDGRAVRRTLASYLGEGPSAEAGAAVRAVARVSESGGAFRLVLRMETASGVTVRETTADDCALLVDATAVILAVAVDPTKALGRPDVPGSDPGVVEPAPVEPPPAPVEPAPTEPAPAPVEPETTAVAPIVEARPVAPAAPPEPRVRFGMRVGGGVDFGVLPGLAGGLRVAGSAFGRGWRAELVGDTWFPRTASVAAGISARVSLWSLGGRGCWVPTAARGGLEFPLCAGIEAGAMRGDPVGDRVAGPTPSRRFWLAASGSGAVAWVPRRYLALVLQAELVVPILRAGFRVGDLAVHRAGPVAGRTLLALETRFP